MLRSVVVCAALICSFSAASGNAINFPARPQSYAATQPRKGFLIIAPLYSGRSVYVGAPPTEYQLIGPHWDTLEAYR